MKHAYLIIAHNEFEVLQQLLLALDDPRNAIFVHIDAKVRKLPMLHTVYADLHIVPHRVDVRWGHVSQIEVTYVLFAAAAKHAAEYRYFHVLSGVHLPLVSQDYIHAFFQSANGKQFIPRMHTNDFQTDLKMNRYNLFMPYFAHSKKMISKPAQIGWRLAQSVQRFLGIRRYRRSDYQYGSNWVSLTHDAVTYLLSIQDDVLRRYRYTLCGDEFFVPTELASSALNFTIEYSDRLLKHYIARANAKVYGAKDYKELLQSDCLFARKFSATDLVFVRMMVVHSQNKK